MKNNQSGMAHVALIIGIVLFVGLIGFVGYRIVNYKFAPAAEPDTDRVNPLTLDNTGLAEAEHETASQDTPPVQFTTIPTPTAATVKQPTPAAPKSTHATPAPSQKRTISFMNVSGSQEGDYVNVSGDLSETQSGTCTYSFSLNGTERVAKTSSISGSNRCSLSVPIDDFPKSATYTLNLSFLSSNGLVSATQAGYDIDVF